MTTAEKRKSVRVPVDVPASFAYNNKNHPGRILNLSSDGALLQAEQLIDHGEEIKLSFDLPGQEIRLTGKVVWGQLVEGNIPAYGMGIHFLQVPVSQYAALQEYIRGLLDS